jgi:hypothetical protein
MKTVLYLFFILCHIALTVQGIRLYRRSPSVAAFIVLLPIMALIYDNGIVALGSLIGEGSLLKTLTIPRFIGHAFLTPIWIIPSIAFARRSGAERLEKRAWQIGAWALYFAMLLLGIVDALVLLDLAPEWDGSVFYYTNHGGLPGPPVPAIMMVLVTLVAGGVVLRNLKWPWMLLGAFFMLVAAGIPARVVGFFVSNAGEVVLGSALIATEWHLQKQKRK